MITFESFSLASLRKFSKFLRNWRYEHVWLPNKVSNFGEFCTFIWQGVPAFAECVVGFLLIDNFLTILCKFFHLCASFLPTGWRRPPHGSGAYWFPRSCSILYIEILSVNINIWLKFCCWFFFEHYDLHLMACMTTPAGCFIAKLWSYERCTHILHAVSDSKCRLKYKICVRWEKWWQCFTAYRYKYWASHDRNSSGNNPFKYNPYWCSAIFISSNRK